jgi:membrane protease YdiL (CAAX protease family)
MRPMARSLASFRAALLAGWGALGLAGILYAQAKGIPAWAAWPALAGFLLEYPFYLVPAFDSARARIHGTSLVWFSLASALLPYLACCLGAIQFTWIGLLKVCAVPLVLSLWYRVQRPSPAADILFLALVAAVILLRYFNPVYAPVDPTIRDLKNLIVIPHISLIAIAVMALMVERRVQETGYGFLPKRRDWGIGLLHVALFLPIGLPLALLLGATHLGDMKPVWFIAATFIGMLWAVSLSEEFLVRGVLQQWIEDWTRSRQGALLLTSAIFGLLHLWLGGFPNWKWALVAGVLGWFCGRARNVAGSIRASMVTHAVVATAWRAFFV